jgi:hypothetical protein
MRIKAVVLTILAIMAVLVPTGVMAADIWQGTAVITTNEPLVVSATQDGAALVSPYTLVPVTVNRGGSFTKTLWVKNTGVDRAFLVTPHYSCNQPNITCTPPIATSIAVGTSVKFDFVMTAVSAGVPCTITLSFTSD